MTQAEQDRIVGRAVREHHRALRLRAAYEGELLRVGCCLRLAADSIADAVARHEPARIGCLTDLFSPYVRYVDCAGLVELVNGCGANEAVIVCTADQLRDLGVGSD